MVFYKHVYPPRNYSIIRIKYGKVYAYSILIKLITYNLYIEPPPPTISESAPFLFLIEVELYASPSLARANLTSFLFMVGRGEGVDHLSSL